MKIYAILGSIGAFLLAVFAAFSAGGKSKANEISAETTKKAKETSDAVTDEIIEGAKRQEEVLHEKVDTSDRTGTL